MVSSLASSAYLWISATGLFMGLAAGQGLKALVSTGEGFLRARRRRPGRQARAIAFLSLGILSLAGLLVLPPKPLSLAIGEAACWAILVFLLAGLAGFRPLAAGLPLAALCIAGLMLARLALEGWLPLRPVAAGSPYLVASLLPYEVGPSSFRGHLELPERDSVPVAQEVGLGAALAAVSVESLALSGPLAFLGDLALVPAPANADSLRLYRVVGIAAPGGLSQSFPVPSHILYLDRILPLPPGAGAEPGGEAASLFAFFGLASRSRLTSPPKPLIALEPVTFSVSLEEGSVKFR